MTVPDRRRPRRFDGGGLVVFAAALVATAVFALALGGLR